MQWVRSKFLVLAGVTAVLIATQVFAATAKGHQILEWDRMIGVPTGLTGAQSLTPLRGINGGGIAWTVKSARGELDADGRLEIRVEGLVLATGANAGMNPINMFRGLVSCVNADGTFTNIPTDPFPATTGPASSGGGDSKIKATVSLPDPCIAPIVFVTSPTGSWFAATGG